MRPVKSISIVALAAFAGMSAAVAQTAPALYTPTDPHFNQQWYLMEAKVQEAWALTKGSKNVIIAIVSPGVDLGHPDIKAKCRLV